VSSQTLARSRIAPTARGLLLAGFRRADALESAWPAAAALQGPLAFSGGPGVVGLFAYRV
jgi:hypothetical protein